MTVKIVECPKCKHHQHEGRKSGGTKCLMCGKRFKICKKTIVGSASC